MDRDDRSSVVDLWRQVRLWPELLTLGECLDLSWTARDPSFFAALAVSKALPSARARFEIRARLAAALDGRPSSAGPRASGLFWNWLR